MLFPFGMLGITDGTVLVNLYSSNNDLLGSWTMPPTSSFTKASFYGSPDVSVG